MISIREHRPSLARLLARHGRQDVWPVATPLVEVPPIDRAIYELADRSQSSSESVFALVDTLCSLVVTLYIAHAAVTRTIRTYREVIFSFQAEERDEVDLLLQARAQEYLSSATPTEWRALLAFEERGRRLIYEILRADALSVVSVSTSSAAID